MLHNYIVNPYEQPLWPENSSSTFKSELENHEAKRKLRVTITLPLSWLEGGLGGYPSELLMSYIS